MSAKIVERDAVKIVCREATIRTNLRCNDGNSVHPGHAFRCLKHSLPWIREKVQLQTLGICRRCRRACHKLKTDLQNLGLSRKQVRRGLIQLATRPLVVLTRQQTARRRYGWRRRLFLDDDEEPSQASSNCTTDARSLECNSRQGNGNADRSHGMEVGAAEKAEVLKAQSTALINDPKPTVLHPFEKALEQLDKIVSSKMNAPEKSVSKRSSVIVSADTTCKSQNKDGASNKHSPPNKKTARSERDNPPTRVGNDNNRATERSFDLVSDQIPINSICTPDRDKRYRIKLNLSSCSNHKKFESATSNVNKKLDTDEGASGHVKEHSPRNKIACPMRDSGGGKSSPEGVSLKGRIASSGNRLAEEDTHKRRLHGETALDCAQKKRKKIRTSYNEIKAIDRKKRKRVLKRFRTLFGDCLTVSEDEQDQDILQKQFKRRRKKDSVDSCDSGVCIAEGSAIANYVEILRDIQRAVPDSTMHEESNEAASKKTTPAKARIIDETKESTKDDESIKTADQVQDTGNGTEVDRLEIKNEVAIVRSVEDVENSVESEAVGHVQNVTAVEAPAVEIITEIIDLVDSPIYDGSIVEETIATTDVPQTFQATTKSELDLPVLDAEAWMDTTATSPSTSENCNGGAEGIKSEDSSGSRKREHADSIDMNELLGLNFNKTCQITSNGNVVSIREHAEENTDGGIDENSNLNISTEVGVNNDEGLKDKEETPNVVEENNNVHSKDTVISPDAGEYGEAVPMNSNVVDASASINKPVLQRSELNSTAEKKDTQANNVPQARLRVLSSAELGSRWCPTPVAPFPSTVPPLSYANPIIMSGNFSTATTVTNSVPSPALPTQTVPAAASAVPTPLVTSPPVETTFSDTTAKEYKDKKNAINAILSKIHDLLLSVRTSSLPPGAHLDKLLAREFIKMKTALEVESFTLFTQNVVKLLNRYKGFKLQPLSLAEVFHYTPILQVMCAKESDKYNNGAVQKPPAHAGPQNAASAPTVQSPYPPNLTQICINISSAQPNYQENVTLQPEANIVPNYAGNMPLPANPAANPLLNMQHMNYRMDMPRPPPQQAYIPRNRPVATNATQGGPLRHVLVSSAAMNQPRKPPYPPNPSFINQQYLQPGYYVSPANAFYAANTPVLNHPIQQNVNPAKISQQQNFNPHMAQQQNINPPHMAQQQNINPPHMVQQQNINPPLVVPQQNMYLAQRVQQQNINPIYMVQQQNINPAPAMQQQNIKPAPAMQQQNIKPAPAMQQQNIKPAPAMQQQNIKPTHLIQQRAVNTPLGMQQQTINPTNQQFQKTVHRKKTGYNTTQGTARPIASKLPQNAQQTVPAMNYIPQPVENMYVPIASQPVPKSVRQSEQVHQAVPTPTQMMALKNFAMEQMKASQDPQAAHSSRTAKQPVPRQNKKESAAPASLESTIKQFYFLEYLSDIQKMMLVKHIDFYFNCTAWLEHGCPGQSWHTTQSERFTLLNFQTLLKQLVDKMMNDLLRNEPCQGPAAANNLLMGIKIDVPSKVQIIVQDSSMIHCQVQVSKAEHVKCETVSLNERSTARQESLSAVEKQSQKKLEAADALQDTKSSDEAEGTKVLPKEEAQKQGPSTEQLQEKKQDDEVTGVENHSETAEILDTSMSNDSECYKDVTEKDSESCAPFSNIETKKNESEMTREDEVVASDLDQSNKDAKQPPNAHLVTVEISPNDDQVKVIDIDAARETRDTVIQRAPEKPEETEQKPSEEVLQRTCALPSPEDSTTCEVPAEEITDSPDDDIKYSNYTDTDASLMKASPVSFIADVRSISLEAFEKLEEGSDSPTAVVEGNIEEEEIKICLFCSKPSTVACSLCLEAKYCSKACSELHWEEHYKICEPVDKSLYF